MVDLSRSKLLALQVDGAIGELLRDQVEQFLGVFIRLDGGHVGVEAAGRVGDDVDLEYGYQSARQTGLAILATLKANLGSLDRISKVVKTLGMVNCSPDFGEQPKVINGYSDLLAEVFGPDNGVGARSAVGMGALPGNITTEIEVIFELNDE